MFGFHEKRKIKKVLYSKTALIILSVPVLLMFYAVYGAYGKKQETTERRVELTAELSVLESRAQELETDIATLNDPRGIETELRSRYEVGKEGEEVIVLIEEDMPSSTEAETTPEEARFWQKLFGR